VLRLLHTADWHLGRRFPSFPEEAQKKLSRARMDVIPRILDVARRHSVNAVLCAGDLFDDPEPESDFWQELAKRFRERGAQHPPVFLVPGNHDPLTPESIWAPGHAFRQALPHWVHVVDRDDFTYELAPDAVLYARPCRSKAGENDLAMALPARDPGDERVRIGCVHGSTFDMDGYETNFPIQRDAGVERGLDYLAIGDTHSFRDVTESLPVPTVYPGAPEPTTFGESGAGHVAIVALFRHGRRPRVDAEPVAFWRWIDVRCHDVNELRNLLTMSDLERHVVRLHLDMTVSLSEESEVERILRDLEEPMRRTAARASSWWIPPTCGCNPALETPFLTIYLLCSGTPLHDWTGLLPMQRTNPTNRGRLARSRTFTNCCRATTLPLEVAYETPMPASFESRCDTGYGDRVRSRPQRPLWT